jgi:hypothetical protein
MLTLRYALGDGLLGCLQDANADVHEEALRALLLTQTKCISIPAPTAAHLMDLLITSLFCSKRPDIVMEVMRSAQLLLRDHLSDTLPVLLKGTICRNLSSGLQSIVCISRSLGAEISDGLSPELMASMVEQLLRVVATAKVGNIINYYYYVNMISAMFFSMFLYCIFVAD